MRPIYRCLEGITRRSWCLPLLLLLLHPLLLVLVQLVVGDTLQAPPVDLQEEQEQEE